MGAKDKGMLDTRVLPPLGPSTSTLPPISFGYSNHSASSKPPTYLTSDIASVEGRSSRSSSHSPLFSVRSTLSESHSRKTSSSSMNSQEDRRPLKVETDSNYSSLRPIASSSTSRNSSSYQYPSNNTSHRDYSMGATRTQSYWTTGNGYTLSNPPLNAYQRAPTMRLTKSNSESDIDEMDEDSYGGGDGSGEHRIKRRAIEKKSRMRRVDALEHLRQVVASEKTPTADPLTQSQRKNCQADICYDAAEIISRLRHENGELHKQVGYLASENRHYESKLRSDDGHQPPHQRGTY